MLRLSLGFVFLWFGVREIVFPESYVRFMPGFVGQHSPVSEESLVRLHGILLTTAGTGMLVGLLYRASCWLALGILVEVIVSLIVLGEDSGLIVRDVGLLGLSLAMLLDPVRFWQFDQVLIPWLRRGFQLARHRSSC